MSKAIKRDFNTMQFAKVLANQDRREVSALLNQMAEIKEKLLKMDLPLKPGKHIDFGPIACCCCCCK